MHCPTAQDDVLGLIIVDSLSLRRLFGPEDLDLLTVLGNVAAIGLEQARLLRVEEERRILARDLDQAAVIQRRLLPSPAPEVPGYEIAGHNAPSRTVGGDYFDYFRYPDGRFAVVVGDVAGKGMPAGSLMTSLKGGVQVLAEVTDDVADLVGRLDRVVASNFPRNRFVSLVLAIPDPGTGVLTYCNGGREVASKKGLLMHMDGARLWNACVATGISPKEYTVPFDSVSACLSKGLGAPAGSVVCGPKDLVQEARSLRKRLGGGMRQAGVLAAAGLFALDHHVERLTEDHENARRLAGLLCEIPGASAVFPVETNLVFVAFAGRT